MNPILIAGAYYTCFKSGQYLGTNIQAATTPEKAALFATAFAAGAGVMTLAPVTGPLGLILAARDIYTHRTQIKTEADKLLAKLKPKSQSAKLYVLKGGSSC